MTQSDDAGDWAAVCAEKLAGAMDLADEMEAESGPVTDSEIDELRRLWPLDGTVGNQPTQPDSGKDRPENGR